jgi:hypothetical protein
MDKTTGKPKYVGRVPFSGLDERDEFQAAFVRLVDVEYFLSEYRSLLPPHVKTEELTVADLFLIYIALVKEHPISPNREFVESFYLETHSDVAAAVRRSDYLCGFHHWVAFGQKEKRLINPKELPSEAPQNQSEAVAMLFDLDYYIRNHMSASRGRVSRKKAIDHFLKSGFSEGIIPVPKDQFDEAFYLLYYPDIRTAKAEGKIPSGYGHYILAGRKEGRLPTHDLGRALEAKLGLLTYPVGVIRANSLRSRLRPISVQITRGRKPVLNVFIPSLDPDLMFGGYIAFFHFLCRWAERGQSLRFIITEDGHGTKEWFLRGIGSRSRWVNAFEAQEYLNLSLKDHILMCSGDDICIAYSCWAAHDAWSVVQHLRQKFFYYFIQEFEPIFHEHDSFHFFASMAYTLPHIAIFNSPILRDYFSDARIGVFSGDRAKPYTYFNHALADLKPDMSVLAAKGRKKRLLFYARPERHAARNLFEVCVLALSGALEDGVIDASWDVIGIGSLGRDYKVEINGRPITIMSRVTQDHYESLLQSFDVGLSLMWAPHPSVVPFEMAKAGMVVVTNTFENRTHKILSRFGHNIVSCDPTIPGMVAGIKEAVHRSFDYRARVLGAEFDLPTSWDAVFTDTFYSALARLSSVEPRSVAQQQRVAPQSRSLRLAEAAETGT